MQQGLSEAPQSTKRENVGHGSSRTKSRFVAALREYKRTLI
jgi:hypothetical protein